MSKLSDEQIVDLVQICKNITKAVEIRWVPQGIPQRNIDTEVVRLFHVALAEHAADIQRLGQLCLAAGILAAKSRPALPEFAALAAEPNQASAVSEPKNEALSSDSETSA